MLLLAACGGGGSGTGEPVSPPPAAFVATSVQDALDYGMAGGLDALWIYIDRDDGEPSTYAAGTENRTTLAPAQPGSRFKIASVSKMFIAVAAVKAIEDGLLRLDDTVVFWLPDLEGRLANANTITLRQLLRHRSGVPDFDSAPGFSWTRAHTDTDVLLEMVLDRPADFAPNNRYEYSNTNYLLVGRILDTALGYSHHDFIQNEILTPLGMVNTYSLLGEADIESLARGYWDDVDRTAQDYVVPGGSMVSTARETGVFLRALATGNLLSANERSLFLSMFSFGHSGWLPGYQSLAYYHADIDTVVIQFVNNTGGGSEQRAQQTYDALLHHLRNP
ncbi:MAG: beta-lactamase family protein [Gammaproteobacteria bacterium]|nr:beta-lactamase family protein [Gammaproteobacteria bacterium]